jgi:hypothetical protein
MPSVMQSFKGFLSAAAPNDLELGTANRLVIHKEGFDLAEHLEVEIR